MNEDPSDASSPGQRSWFDRISSVLLGEPKSQDELIVLLREAQQRNILDLDALTMIEGVLDVAETRVRDVMVPRPQMQMVNVNWSLDKLLAKAIESGHSRFPVMEDGRDDIIGILIVKDLLRYFSEHGQSVQLRDILRPAKFIPESKRLNTLLKEFRSTRLHMAIVVDEYGGVSGLITIEDVLEQIVGEIDDEHDDDEEFIRRLDGERFTVKALTPVEDFNEYFSANLSDERADTMGGLIITELGRVPCRGDEVTLERYKFKVLGADNRRVHLLEMHILDERDIARSAE